MIKSITVCEATDILAFAEEHKMGGWNEIHDLIWRGGEDNAHRHFHLSSFVITLNWFNPKYQDDAYGLRWDKRLQKIVKAFMAHHKLKRFMVCTDKNHSLMVL